MSGLTSSTTGAAPSREGASSANAVPPTWSFASALGRGVSGAGTIARAAAGASPSPRGPSSTTIPGMACASSQRFPSARRTTLRMRPCSRQRSTRACHAPPGALRGSSSRATTARAAASHTSTSLVGRFLSRRSTICMAHGASSSASTVHAPAMRAASIAAASAKRSSCEDVPGSAVIAEPGWRADAGTPRRRRRGWGLPAASMISAVSDTSIEPVTSGSSPRCPRSTAGRTSPRSIHARTSAES